MVHFLGEIVKEEIILSEIGGIVKTEWLKTFMLRPDMNLWIGEFMIMPNHFHAIIGIGSNVYNTENGDAKHGDAKHRVITGRLIFHDRQMPGLIYLNGRSEGHW